MRTTASMMTRLVALFGIAIIGIFSFPANAFAANGGSGAPDVPPINLGGTPGGSTVLCTFQVAPAGGTVGCSGISVTVGPTTGGVQVVLSSGLGPACTVTPAIGVAFFDPTTSQKFTGTFNAPVSVTYTNGAVEAGETVLIFDSATGQWIPAPSGTVTSASTSDGKVTLSATGTATFSVQSEVACGAEIPGATVVTTGKPFLGESLLAGGLMIGGLLTLLVIVRRRSALNA
jgi:hypothetical protein